MALNGIRKKSSDISCVYVLLMLLKHLKLTAVGDGNGLRGFARL